MKPPILTKDQFMRMLWPQTIKPRLPKYLRTKEHAEKLWQEYLASINPRKNN